MNVPAIRPAVPVDHAAIEALQRRSSLTNAEYRDQLLAHPDALGLDLAEIVAGRVLVAVDEAGLTGYANWIPGGVDGEAELDGLFVDPDRWRGGIGRALVAAVGREVRGRGYGRMIVAANPAALDFYQRCGFVLFGETQTRFGPAPVMECRLD